MNYRPLDLGFILVLIPARGGSVRLPGKNLAKVGGRSLVARAVDTARATAQIAEVLVSSDDPAILDEAVRAGAAAEVRPAPLASSSATTREVVDDLLGRRHEVDVLVILQPTSPLRVAADVEACLGALDRHDTVTSVTACEYPARWSMLLDGEGLLTPQAVSWSSALATGTQHEVRPNGAVYAARTKHLRAGGDLVGPGTAAVEMPRSRSVDIDDALDLHVARLLEMHPLDE